MRFEHMLKARPVEVHWAGWKSDTYTLQQAGWSLSAHQDVMRMQMQMAFRNERAGMSAITAPINWEYERYMHDGYDSRLPALPVHMMSHKVQIQHTMGNPFEAFRAIDAKPFMAERRISSLEDLVHFAPAMARTQQIIVPEESVDDLMARILDMQSGPRIERIRQEIREGERVSFEPRQKFHAQIVSIAA